jgi:hypothetical protein
MAAKDLPNISLKMIPGPLSMLLLVICNSVKMGIRLCYKWDEPK